MVLGKMDQFIKEIDIKTVLSIVRESKLGQSCWAVTQRGLRVNGYATVTNGLDTCTSSDVT